MNNHAETFNVSASTLYQPKKIGTIHICIYIQAHTGYIYIYIHLHQLPKGALSCALPAWRGAAEMCLIICHKRLPEFRFTQCKAICDH